MSEWRNEVQGEHGVAVTEGGPTIILRGGHSCYHSRLGTTPQYIANSETNKSSCTLDLERKKRRMLVHTQIELI
jgi:hypothetical protein